MKISKVSMGASILLLSVTVGCAAEKQSDRLKNVQNAFSPKSSIENKDEDTENLGLKGDEYQGPKVLGVFEEILEENGKMFVKGWACDRSVWESINVHVYAGKEIVANGVANLAATGKDSKDIHRRCNTKHDVAHRYKIEIPNGNLFKSSKQLISAWGISKSNLNNHMLTPYGKKAIYMPSLSVKGNIDGVDEEEDGTLFVRGWTCETALSTTLSVHVYTSFQDSAVSVPQDAQYITAGVANLESEDGVAKACGSDIGHRFRIEVPETERGKHMYIYGLSQIDGYNNVISNQGFQVPTF